MRLPDHLEQGYETEYEFRSAIERLVDWWHDREGECIDERSGHLRLRFHDTPGGMPDEAWMPSYILHPIDTPEYMASTDSSDEIRKELHLAFGFD